MMCAVATMMVSVQGRSLTAIVGRHHPIRRWFIALHEAMRSDSRLRSCATSSTYEAFIE